MAESILKPWTSTFLGQLQLSEDRGKWGFRSVLGRRRWHRSRWVRGEHRISSTRRPSALAMWLAQPSRYCATQHCTLHRQQPFHFHALNLNLIPLLICFHLATNTTQHNTVASDAEATQAHQARFFCSWPRLCPRCLAPSRLSEPRTPQKWRRHRSRHWSQGLLLTLFSILFFPSMVMW